MSQEQDHMDEGKKKSGLFWMLVPIGLLVTSVSGWLLMVSMAVDDPGFAVEPDYYKKASNYDSVIEQRAENSRLGYGVEVVSYARSSEETAQLMLSVRDSDGAPLKDARVSADIFPVARAFDVQSLSLQHRDAGIFEATLQRPRTGLWEVRVKVEVGGSVFTRILRPELSAPEGARDSSSSDGGPPA